jgi:hypothetical protein
MGYVPKLDWPGIWGFRGARVLNFALSFFDPFGGQKGGDLRAGGEGNWRRGPIDEIRCEGYMY